MRVLVLGGYGLIGSAIAKNLAAQGHDIRALGRNRATALRVLPDAEWHIADMAQLTTAEAWQNALEGIQVVVNAAGALQDGPDAQLDVIHYTAPKALFAACAQAQIRVVQISAVGVRADAKTHFLRSKAQGDQALRDSGAEFTILRPGLVLSQTAYGGTALLRMLAAVPLIQPIAMPKAQMQTITIPDLCCAVRTAVVGELPPAATLDLVEDTPQSLQQITATLRHWLGFRPARMTLTMPRVVTRAVSRLADGLGRLGWRSPLRSTAIAVLDDGVLGDPEPARALGVQVLPMAKGLARLSPAGVEHRLQARLSLMKPIAVGMLILFWLVSGVIGLVQIGPAAQVLQDVGWVRGVSMAAVVSWSLVDIALAVALAYRPTAKAALWGMVLVPAIYLLSASVITPWMWADPLGPLVKVLPATLLPLLTLTMLESR